ncbi:hypothetical protein Cch01nite_22680 [Cellulomonas chitinilytica]|uniref:DUF2510 domain-containing protein n=1 Tax=Cellulomonas chitinilytica TaxID=398759 RepID=A0A919P545_9CELL|nr:DUF2510 domain-containing protein [Cellulomonas chitinilytica]GIG21544.1 hypothetical protein Cch01nite_22680 [Cellulomonas chitinilytica]
MSTAFDQAGSTPVAGWYPDPHAPGAHRWWDGTQWTQHTQQEPAPAAPTYAAPGYPTQHADAVPGYPQQQAAGTAGFGAAPGGVPGYPSASVGGVPGYPVAGGGYPSGAGVSFPGGATSTYPGTWSATGAYSMEKPKNRTATWALVAGIVVILVLLFTDYAIASWLAIFVGIQGVKKARAIRAEGYPKAVGMGRAVTGLVLSGISAALFVLSFALR